MDCFRPVNRCVFFFPYSILGLRWCEVGSDSFVRPHPNVSGIHLQPASEQQLILNNYRGHGANAHVLRSATTSM